MASDYTPVEAEDNVDEGNSRSVVPPQSDRDLAHIHEVRRSITPLSPPVCGWPDTDPHYNAYPEVRRQNPYEVFGRASSGLEPNPSTDVSLSRHFLHDHPPPETTHLTSCTLAIASSNLTSSSP
jgi:hypothetical protein